MSEPELISARHSIVDNGAEGLLLKTEQYIPDDFVSELRKQRIDADHEPMGEMFHFACIPQAIFDHLIKLGYDVNNMDVREWTRALNRLDFEGLITTNKQLY